MAGIFDTYKSQGAAAPPPAKTGGLFDTYKPQGGAAPAPAAEAGPSMWDRAGDFAHEAGDSLARVGTSMVTGGLDMGRVPGQWLRAKIQGVPYNEATGWDGKKMSEGGTWNEAVTKGLDIEPKPGMSGLRQTAEEVAPFLLGGGLSKVQEAVGAMPKLAAIGRRLVSGGTDYAIARGAGEAAHAAGWDEPGSVGATLTALASRSALTRGAGMAARARYGAPDAPRIFDAVTAENGPRTMPTFGQVSNPRGKGLEAQAAAFPLSGGGTDAAKARVDGANEAAIGRSVEALGGNMHVDPQTTAGRLINASQERSRNLVTTNRADQEALDTQVGPRTTGNAVPLWRAISSTANDTGIGEPVRNRLEDIRSSVGEDIRRATPDLAPGPSSAPTAPSFVPMGQENAHIQSLPAGPARAAAIQELMTTGRISIPAPPSGPSGASPAPFPPTPQISYGAAKQHADNIRRLARDEPNLKDHFSSTGARNPLIDTRREIANNVDPSLGAEFDRIRTNYATMKNTQLPFLENTAGQFRNGVFTGTPEPGTVAARLQPMVKGRPGDLTGIEREMPGTSGPLIGDTIGNMGRQPNTPFRSKTFAKNYGEVGQPSRAIIHGLDPVAGETLGNVETSGNALAIPRQDYGLGKSVGGQGMMFAALNQALEAVRNAGAAGKVVGGAATLGVPWLYGHALQSPELVRAVAGRPDIAGILGQLGMRGVVGAQQNEER
jgi:hypothetical protein